MGLLSELLELSPVATPATPATQTPKSSKSSKSSNCSKLPDAETGNSGPSDAPLPARVRQRFRDCCARLGIEPEPILRQFDYWKYTARDLQDMDAWPDEIVETHTRLLLSEVTDGLP